jgi:hypothetical protein
MVNGRNAPLAASQTKYREHLICEAASGGLPHNQQAGFIGPSLPWIPAFFPPIFEHHFTRGC